MTDLRLRKDEPMEIIPAQPGLGPLAAALAKAQSEFGAVTKDKTVTVTTKSGGQYKFAYAPLDSILNVVREPLSKHGLVVTQLLDTDALVTMLIHESGASLEARTPLPSNGDIQAYGSAITYLRRYAIQALLGIAAEDDDDANAAAGNQAVPTVSGGETLELIGAGPVTGVVKKGGKDADKYQANWRETPDGHVIGFALKRNGDAKDLPQVGLMGAIAQTLFASGEYPTGEEFIGQKLTLHGRFYNVKQQGRTTYQRMIVGQSDRDFVETPDFRVPPLADPEQVIVDANPEGVSPLREDAIPIVDGQLGFDQAESDRIDAEAAAAG